MKTRIEYTDGRVEEVEDAAPSFCLDEDEDTFDLINKASECVTDMMPLAGVLRVVFEP